MRSEYTFHCKFCEAKRHWESHWLPVEILEAFANIWIVFHALRHHPKEFGKKNRLIYAGKQTFWSIIIILLFSVFTVLRIVFFPLYWLLEKLYE